MQRTIILDMAEQAEARSVASLSRIERGDLTAAAGQESAFLMALLGIGQELQALRLTILATMAPADS